MSDAHAQHSSVNWGGLGKKILAGAAIVAGIILVFPGLGPQLMDFMKTIGTAVGNAFSSAAADLTASTAPGEASPAIASGLGSLIKKAAGVFLAVAGYKYLTAEKKESAPAPEVDESFAMREDMRKMQALMMARMQATGYQPAAAAAQQQGRG